MSTTPISSHQISLPEAIDLTHRFQANRTTAYPICETFGIGAISGLISVARCASFRIYLGQRENGEIVTVLTAVNEDGEDILPSLEASANSSTKNAGDPVILEDGFRCPQDCPKSSPLIIT